MSDRQPNVAIISIIVIVLLAAATIGTVALTKKSETPKDDKLQTESSTTETSNETNPESESAGTYKDGTYSATGAYSTPGGQETITVNITLSDGVITNTSAKASEGSSTATEYQSKFIGGYKDLVVGKKIDDVSLSRVSGSSLTSNGFNNAIQTIKKDAQSS